MLRTRPDWDFYFMTIAQVVAMRSLDPSHQVGAVFTDHAHRIVATGYNGFPSGINDCEERWLNRDLKLKYVVHAERNGILSAAHRGVSTNGTTLYCTLPPCTECTKDAIQAGVYHVVHGSATEEAVKKWGPDFAFARGLLDERRIKVTEFSA